MRNLLIGTMAFMLVWGCNNTTIPAEDKTESNTEVVSYEIYGDTITADGAVSVDQLLTMMNGKDSVQVKVEGTVLTSCKMKGCWMKVDMGNSNEMHVSFKDYGFFVPMDLDGETAIMDGYASVDTLDVDYLRHLASDAGKSQEEIDAITEPEITVTYVATGVLIEPKEKNVQ